LRVTCRAHDSFTCTSEFLPHRLMIYLTTLFCRRMTAEVLSAHTRPHSFPSGSVQQSDQPLGSAPSPEPALISRQAGGSTLPDDHITLGTFDRLRYPIFWLIPTSLLLVLAHRLLKDDLCLYGICYLACCKTWSTHRKPPELTVQYSARIQP
jgi:hypothetical protein